MTTHNVNSFEIDKLINYYLGKQKILSREEAYTSGVNNKTVLNYAQSVTRDIVGYTFGKDIEYVPKDPKKSDAVKILNNVLQQADMSLIDIQTAIFASICGIGYKCILPSDDYEDEPEIGIKAGALNPRTTFVIHSYELGNPVLLACTYYTTNTKTVYTVYDKDYVTIFETKGTSSRFGPKQQISRKPHGLGGIPISVVENTSFLMGDFEPGITVLDAINQVASDSVNDIENFVKSVLVFVNASLGDDETERDRNRSNIKKNRIIEVKVPQGMQADVKYITEQLSADSTKNIREYLEESLWKILGIPDRKTRGGGGGDTGEAVKLRDGWGDIEVVARNKEKYFKKAVRQQLIIAIKLLKVLNKLPEDFTISDIDIKFSRNKNDNLQVKAQAFSTLNSTKKLHPADTLEIVDITTNVNEMVERGDKYWASVIEQENKMLEQKVDNPEDKTKKNVEAVKDE